MKIVYKDIPTYNSESKEWSKTSFSSQEEFAYFLDGIFKEPGEYEFDESTKLWNIEARRYREKGYYIRALKNSKEYKEYWNTQKDRCRRGVIYINGNKTWYVTREYYMLLNFLPIINKEKGNTEGFMDVRDVQYHLALYEKRAEAHNKHGVVTKKRQMASSYYHSAKMINVYWFEKKAILRNLAGDESYLTGEKGIWNYYNNYRDFLNEHTGWIRENSPNQDLKWIQRREALIGNRKSFTGRKSILTGTTFKRSATAGVGGPSYYNYFEEAGTFPKLDKTYYYMKPALEAGPGITTGFFIAAGSVGELKDCGPLKKFMENPEENGFLGVSNQFATQDRVPKITGLYIPQQWGMLPFIDEFGNSLVEEALDYLNKYYEKLEKELDASDYQLYISQHPRYMSEAFAYREITKFPMRRIEKQQMFLKENPGKGRAVELYEDEKGNVRWKNSDKKDVGYPINPKSENKEGVVMMYIDPHDNIKMGDFFGGVDNIEVGMTQTSNSVFSIYILKSQTEVTIVEDGKVVGKRIEAPRIAASWTGRINSEDPSPSNKVAELLIRLYKAYTLCERNKPNFITHMRKQGLAYLLATEKDVPIYKDLDFGKNSNNNDIGIYMDSTGKKQDICDSYLIELLNSEVDVILEKDKEGNDTGRVIKTYTWIDTIEDYWLLEELKNPNDNTDRRDAIRLAATLMSIWASNNVKSRRVEHKSGNGSMKKEEDRTRYVDMMGALPQSKNKKKQRIIYL